MNFDFPALMGKNIKLTDIDNQIFIGNATSLETPEDSEDGKWYLDVDVPGFGLLNISESEIKSIEIV